MGSHESSVQGFLSSQTTVLRPLQIPAEHVSPAVHAFLSSHGFVFGTLAHPVAGTHESLVQALLSLQSTYAPDLHLPPEQ
jgi:hypothetical protein